MNVCVYCAKDGYDEFFKIIFLIYLFFCCFEQGRGVSPDEELLPTDMCVACEMPVADLASQALEEVRVIYALEKAFFSFFFFFFLSFFFVLSSVFSSAQPSLISF